MTNIVDLLTIIPKLQGSIGYKNTNVLLPGKHKRDRDCRASYGHHCFPPTFPPCSKAICAEECAALLKKMLVPLHRKYFGELPSVRKFAFRERDTGEPLEEGYYRLGPGWGRRPVAVNGMLLCCGDDLDKPLFFSSNYSSPPRFDLEWKPHWWHDVKATERWRRPQEPLGGAVSTVWRYILCGGSMDKAGYDTKSAALTDDRIADALCWVFQNQGCPVLSVWAVVCPDLITEDVPTRGNIYYGQRTTHRKHTYYGHHIERRGPDSNAFRLINSHDWRALGLTHSTVREGWEPTRDRLYAAKVGSIRVDGRQSSAKENEVAPLFRLKRVREEEAADYSADKKRRIGAQKELEERRQDLQRVKLMQEKKTKEGLGRHIRPLAYRR